MIPSVKIYENTDDGIAFTALNVIDKHSYYYNFDSNKIYFLNIPKNASSYIRDVTMHLLKNPETNPKSFCIIRNPLDRFVSIFKYMVDRKKYFDDFFESVFLEKNLLNKTYIKEGVGHLLPQKFFVDNAPAEWKNNCQLITMENFFGDGAVNGIKKVGLLPKSNVSNKKTNQSHYGDSYKEWLVNEIYSKYSKVFDEYLEQDYELYEQAKNNSVLFD